jgi:hypothetical protein
MRMENNRSVTEIKKSIDKTSYTEYLYLLEEVYKNERIIRSKEENEYSKVIRNQLGNKELLTRILYKISKIEKSESIIFVPVEEFSNLYHIGLERKVKALAFTYSINQKMSSNIAICVGIVYLMGGNEKQIEMAIQKMRGAQDGIVSALLCALSVL